MSQDHQWMQRAIKLAEMGRITAPPNPWVGCVIVKEGIVIGEGYHVAPGEPHAEVNALRQAGSEAKGATVYLTLEPCVHYGRTAPCSNALIEAGVAKVVVGIEDPDLRVSGKGIEQLLQAGVEVLVGVMAQEVYTSLEPYIHHRKKNRPYCVAKTAISVDGRTAAEDRTSKWISSAEARSDAHKIRAESQAILIGTGTALTDNPKLTVRDYQPIPKKQPLRVLLDTHGKVTTFSPLFDSKLAPTLVFTSVDCNKEMRESWEKAGAEVVVVAKDPAGLDLHEVLQNLSNRGVVQLLVEGGATLYGEFIKKGLLDHLVVYVGSCLLGDTGEPLFRNLGITTMNDRIPLNLTDVRVFETSVRINYKTKGN